MSQIVLVDRSVVKARLDSAHLLPAWARVRGGCLAFTRTTAARSAADVTDRVVRADNAASKTVRICIRAAEAFGGVGQRAAGEPATRYRGIEVDDAVEIAEKIDICANAVHPAADVVGDVLCVVDPGWLEVRFQDEATSTA